MNYSELSLAELREIAREKGIGSITTYRKAELIDLLEREAPQSLPVVEEHSRTDDVSEAGMGEGILEVLQDGFGFLRTNNYLTGAGDIYVAPSQIRRFNLKTGDSIKGKIRLPRENEKFSALLFVTDINGDKPEVAKQSRSRPFFLMKVLGSRPSAGSFQQGL